MVAAAGIAEFDDVGFYGDLTAAAVALHQRCDATARNQG
jgi:hypothetical protein